VRRRKPTIGIREQITLVPSATGARLDGSCATAGCTTPDSQSAGRPFIL
jgi:hypothetical protein